MDNKERFHKIAENFMVYIITNEEVVEDIRAIYKDKKELHLVLRNLLHLNEYDLKTEIKLEMFSSLIKFSIEKDFENVEICTLLAIFWEIFNLNYLILSKRDVFVKFKNSIIRHSMDRPPYQIGVFKKTTIEVISDYYVENIYKKYEILKFLLTNNQNVEIVQKNIFDLRFPHVLNIDSGHECLARSAKILKPYYENKKPKSELEQKIEAILEFERERLDKVLESKFSQQDEAFNKKVEELVKKKK